MWVFFTVVLAAVALLLYASLWVPRLGRRLYWDGGRAVRPLGFVSRLGFMLIFGVPALVGIVGMPAEKYRGFYGGAMALGCALVVLGFFNDWLRDNA